MTVAQLIDELQKLDPTLNVMAQDEVKKRTIIVSIDGCSYVKINEPWDFDIICLRMER